MLALAM